MATREHMKKKRLLRKEAGLCPTCGQRPEAGFVYCQACRERNAAANIAYRAACKAAKISKERRDQLLERGICLRCGGKTSPGHVYCLACLQKMRVYGREYARARKKQAAVSDGLAGLGL